MTATTAPQHTAMGRLLDVIERAGNRVPHPVLMFLYLIIGVIVLSAVLAFAGVSVTEEIVVPDAVQTVPGVTNAGGGNPNMSGASSNENTYALDGANARASQPAAPPPPPPTAQLRGPPPPEAARARRIRARCSRPEPAAQRLRVRQTLRRRRARSETWVPRRSLPISRLRLIPLDTGLGRIRMMSTQGSTDRLAAYLRRLFTGWSRKPRHARTSEDPPKVVSTDGWRQAHDQSTESWNIVEAEKILSARLAAVAR